LYTGIVLYRQPHGVGTLKYINTNTNTNNSNNSSSNTEQQYVCIYEGFWYYGGKDGYGRTLFVQQNDIHVGLYQKNVRHGLGQYQWNDGRNYDGNYINDIRHGHGIIRYPNGESYVGYVLCFFFVILWFASIRLNFCFDSLNVDFTSSLHFFQNVLCPLIKQKNE
jgi:hypothetical protein